MQAAENLDRTPDFSERSLDPVVTRGIHDTEHLKQSGSVVLADKRGHLARRLVRGGYEPSTYQARPRRCTWVGSGSDQDQPHHPLRREHSAVNDNLAARRVAEQHAPLTGQERCVEQPASSTARVNRIATPDRLSVPGQRRHGNPILVHT